MAAKKGKNAFSEA